MGHQYLPKSLRAGSFDKIAQATSSRRVSLSVSFEYELLDSDIYVDDEYNEITKVGGGTGTMTLSAYDRVIHVMLVPNESIESDQLEAPIKKMDVAVPADEFSQMLLAGTLFGEFTGGGSMALIKIPLQEQTKEQILEWQKKMFAEGHL